MGAIQSLLTKPKEEFPPTGIATCDNIVNQVKEVVAILNKAEQMIKDFQTKAKTVTAPTEPKELLDKAKGLIEAPTNLAKENAHLFDTVPEYLQEPSKLFQDPMNAYNNIKSTIGDPDELIGKYKKIIEDYKTFGEEAKGLPEVATAKVDEYKKLIQDQLMTTYDYLKELLKILPIFQDLTGKLKTFEEDLKAELVRFKGGFCSAAKSAILIKHNIDSIGRYRQKYEVQIEEAKRIAGEATELKQEVDKHIETAQGYQNKAESIVGQMRDYQSKVQGLENQATRWLGQSEDLKKMLDDIKADPAKFAQQKIGEASNLASGALNKFKNMW